MSPRSSRILAAAAAIVALHVLDDATLHREPGTWFVDYATGTLVILGLITGSALVFRHLRTGAQMALALVLGVFAIAVGAPHLIEVRRGPGSAWDAVVGLLTVGAGVTAIVVAAIAVWTGRRRHDRPARRALRGAVMLVGAVLLGFFVLIPMALAVVVTHRPRFEATPIELGSAYEEVTLTTSDGLELAGWYAPSKNGAAVLTFPRRTGAADHARMLVRHGYGVLLVDARGYDASEGRSNVFGWGESKDLAAAVDFLESRPDVRPGAIGGLGLSVGGEQLLEAAAADDRLAAVVSDGAGFRTLHEATLDGFSMEAAQLAVALGIVRVLSPERYPEPLDRLVSKISPRAVMLIEAEHGQGGEEHNAEYFALAGEPKVHWRVPGAHHTGGLDTHPAEYERRVIAFLDRYLVDASS